MITWLKNLLWNQATFEQYIRTGLAGFWAAYEMGLIPGESDQAWLWYLTRAALVLAFVFRAGEKNPQAEAPPKARRKRLRTPAPVVSP
jgi:hypothetical protein